MKCLTCGEPATTKALVGFTEGVEDKGRVYQVTFFSFPACESCLKVGKSLGSQHLWLGMLWVMWVVAMIVTIVVLQWNTEPPYDLSNKMLPQVIVAVSSLLFVLVVGVFWQLSYNKRLKLLFSDPLNAEIERNYDGTRPPLTLCGTEDDKHIQRYLRDARVISCDHLEP